MNRKSISPIPEPSGRLQRQLDEFRNTRQRRTKLPESLWQAAVELARQNGVYSVTHSLRLDYMGLKKRLGEPLKPPTKRLAKMACEMACQNGLSPQSDNVPFEQSRNVPLTTPSWGDARRTTTDDAIR